MNIKDILVNSVPATGELVSKVLKGVQVAAVTQIVTKHVTAAFRKQILSQEDIECQQALKNIKQYQYIKEHPDEFDIREDENKK